ncbi:MAG: hypothetical protein GY769_16180 [bacterium]|nr:hypothetical protein [bacterium]
MTAKPLPPGRPPGAIDLLEATDAEGAPRNGVPDASWRADALGRSRHSRLADEMRPPSNDPDPARAELVCSRIARQALGDFAPALILLSKKRRRRAQVLTAWTVTLFDLACRPGLAGLDGDRLAQINAWEFRTEEALDGGPPGEPVFVAMANENQIEPWPQEALDRLVACARRVALADEFAPVGRPVFETLFGASGVGTAAARGLAPLIDVALARAATGGTADDLDAWIESVRSVRVAIAPAGWRRAASYGKRALLRLLSEGGSGAGARLGLAGRLRLLAASALRPR